MSLIVSDSSFITYSRCYAVYQGGVILPSSFAALYALSSCSIVTPSTAIACVLPQGLGVITQITITVFDQSASIRPVGLAYDPPVFAQAYPLTVTSDMNAPIILRGSGFGWSTSSIVVWITADTSGLCYVSSSAVIFAHTVNLLNDTYVAVSFPPLPYLFPRASLTLVVSGQVMEAPVTVTISPPSVASLAFSTQLPVPPYYFIDIVGTGFGSTISSSVSTDDCTPSGVWVTVNLEACVNLTITVVRIPLLRLCLKFTRHLSCTAPTRSRTSSCCARRPFPVALCL